MKKILIAVDETKATKEIFEKCLKICKCMAPEEILLLYVIKFEGPSLLDDMVGEPELSTLREVLEGTAYKEALDRKAEKVLGYYKGRIEQNAPVPNVTTIVKSGHPAAEILSTAKEREVDMIFIGSTGIKGSQLLMRSVSREVVYNAECPVLVVK